MKNYTQKELLSEGFWDGFKPKNWGKVARGAVRAGAGVLRTVAPELTNPIDNAERAVRGWGNSFKQGYGGVPDPLELAADAKNKITNQVAKSVYDKINMGLASQNLTIIPRFGVEPCGIDEHNGDKLYKLKVSDARNPRGLWVVVNGKGIRK